MPGLYLHIPFCKKACHYCNFHFSTSLKHRESMTPALLREMALRRHYLPDTSLDSVYFGGGTPSLLPVKEIAQLCTAAERLWGIAPGAEITLEANPDDMSDQWLNDLKNYTPVNRLSIGIQSFSEEDLQWMNRAHTATHARECLEKALYTGFDDLTIDLIYGTPTTSDAQWAENLRMAFAYGIPHLSCYCLTVEEGTALHHFVRKGATESVDDDRAARQLEYLMETSRAAGYEQYEISNFALPGRHARHNSSYWTGESYLGIGPAAHSYNGISRQWNIANNAAYLAGIHDETPRFEQEILTPEQRYNEYVMTMLRTHWGCDQARLSILHPKGAAAFVTKAAAFIADGVMEYIENHYRLTPKGRLLADRIAMEMFV